MIFFSTRPRESHKGTFGHLCVVGGSPGLTGAVCLSSVAALRTGCGCVTAAVPASLNSIFEEKLTEEMTLPLSEGSKGTLGVKAAKECLVFLKKRCSAMLLGPGIGTSTETGLFLQEILLSSSIPAVLDADGLRCAANNSLILQRNDPMIITPHLGEMEALSGFSIETLLSSPREYAKQFALCHKKILVLKGHRTIITDGRRIETNLTGNPGMATAGSGDVLAGMIGSFLAQGYSPWESAVTGVYLHGLAGDFASREEGEESMVASDIIRKIPAAIRFLIHTQRP
jgi:hydroxyethylthiazole kinase-like uncharacterized protein yjeF